MLQELPGLQGILEFSIYVSADHTGTESYNCYIMIYWSILKHTNCQALMNSINTPQGCQGTEFREYTLRRSNSWTAWSLKISYEIYSNTDNCGCNFGNSKC